MNTSFGFQHICIIDLHSLASFMSHITALSSRVNNLLGKKRMFLMIFYEYASKSTHPFFKCQPCNSLCLLDYLHYFIDCPRFHVCMCSSTTCLFWIYEWAVVWLVVLDQIAWALNKGIKTDLKKYWDVERGVTYVPWEKVKPDDILSLQEGGMLDSETLKSGKHPHMTFPYMYSF